jgi:hypothetical protein
MNRRCLSAVSILVITLFACAGFARAEEMVANPQYTAWAKFKPGTMITMKMATTGAQALNMQIVQTLKEVTPEKAAVDVATKMDMGGQTRDMPTQTVSVDAKVTKDKAAQAEMPPGMKGDVKQLADEDVTVGGKTYKAKVSEFSGEQQGMKVKGKAWRSDEVPGGVVKMESSYQGPQGNGDMKMELVSVDAK